MPSIRKGNRIKLIHMPNDPDPIPAGSEGLVVEVTDGAYPQIIVEWRNLKRSLALIPGVDRFEIIESPKEGLNGDKEAPR